QGLVRHRSETGYGGYAALGGARPDPGREDERRGPARDGAAGRRLADRAGGEPLDRVLRPRGAAGPNPALCRSRLDPPRLPLPRPRPASVPQALRRAGVAVAALKARLR